MKYRGTSAKCIGAGIWSKWKPKSLGWSARIKLEEGAYNEDTYAFRQDAN